MNRLIAATLLVSIIWPCAGCGCRPGSGQVSERVAVEHRPTNAQSSGALVDVPSQSAQARKETPYMTNQSGRGQVGRAKPFPLARGSVRSVDLERGLIVVQYKTTAPKEIQITAETRIMKGGKPASLKDAKVGDLVTGRVIRTPDGGLRAISLKLESIEGPY